MSESAGIIDKYALCFLLLNCIITQAPKSKPHNCNLITIQTAFPPRGGFFMCLINPPYLYLLRFWNWRFLTKGKSYFYDLCGIPRGDLETNPFKVNPSEAKKIWKLPLWLPQRLLKTECCNFENKNALKKQICVLWKNKCVYV